MVPPESHISTPVHSSTTVVLFSLKVWSKAGETLGSILKGRRKASGAEAPGVSQVAELEVKKVGMGQAI